MIYLVYYVISISLYQRMMSSYFPILIKIWHRNCALADDFVWDKGVTQLYTSVLFHYPCCNSPSLFGSLWNSFWCVLSTIHQLCRCQIKVVQGYSKECSAIIHYLAVLLIGLVKNVLNQNGRHWTLVTLNEDAREKDLG